MVVPRGGRGPASREEAWRAGSFWLRATMMNIGMFIHGSARDPTLSRIPHDERQGRENVPSPRPAVPTWGNRVRGSGRVRGVGVNPSNPPAPLRGARGLGDSVPVAALRLPPANLRCPSGAETGRDYGIKPEVGGLCLLRPDQPFHSRDAGAGRSRQVRLPARPPSKNRSAEDSPNQRREIHAVLTEPALPPPGPAAATSPSRRSGPGEPKDRLRKTRHGELDHFRFVRP